MLQVVSVVALHDADNSSDESVDFTRCIFKSGVKLNNLVCRLAIFLLKKRFCSPLSIVARLYHYKSKRCGFILKSLDILKL